MCAALPPQQWKGEVGDVVGTVQHSLRQRWSNDEMRATDERERERGSDSRDRASEQVASWSSDNRAGSVTRLPHIHRKSSFPRRAAHAQSAARPAERPIGQFES